MKTLQKTVILERNHVAMVMKERNLLARLHCPQLVNMHYAFQDDRNLFIVMDVCLGGDLHYQLTHSPLRCFSEDQARFYAAGIILGLEYMHGVGVMHRDIKPENLLLDRRGQLKVRTKRFGCCSCSSARAHIHSKAYADHGLGY
jgi:serine/threonine protein kinase